MNEELSHMLNCLGWERTWSKLDTRQGRTCECTMLRAGHDWQQDGVNQTLNTASDTLIVIRFYSLRSQKKHPHTHYRCTLLMLLLSSFFLKECMSYVCLFTRFALKIKHPLQSSWQWEQYFQETFRKILQFFIIDLKFGMLM